MRRTTDTWPIDQLRHRFVELEFPDYQREPNVWRREAKQRLIDSIAREFDIASVYFYEQPTGVLECIDGRQRINAIMSFLGRNADDEDDNAFPFKVSNEIYDDAPGRPAQLVDGKTFEELDALAEAAESGPINNAARSIRSKVLGYQINVVLLSGVEVEEEFNLQFIRLNLGTLINAGEKLHAMMGEMRTLLFESEKLGKHEFFSQVDIPNRRYAKELVAGQIVAQVFSHRESGEFTRTRHFDLQRFLKRHYVLSADERGIVDELSETLDELAACLESRPSVFRNRAITVTAVLFVVIKRHEGELLSLEEFLCFLDEFLVRLAWQIGLMREFRPSLSHPYLVDFQRHVTQASVERPAVERRHRLMLEAFAVWQATQALPGDVEFEEKLGYAPGAEPL